MNHYSDRCQCLLKGFQVWIGWWLPGYPSYTTFAFLALITLTWQTLCTNKHILLMGATEEKDLRSTDSVLGDADSPFLCRAPQIRRSRQTSCGPRWSPPWRQLAQPRSFQLQGRPHSARPRWRSSVSNAGQQVTKQTYERRNSETSRIRRRTAG